MLLVPLLLTATGPVIGRGQEIYLTGYTPYDYTQTNEGSDGYRREEILSMQNQFLGERIAQLLVENQNLETKLAQANEFNSQLINELGTTNPQNEEPTMARPTKRTGNMIHVFRESNLNGARQSNNTHLFPGNDGDVPFSCPDRTYPNRYILVCEARWRDIIGRK